MYLPSYITLPSVNSPILPYKIDLEVRLALLGSLHRSQVGFSSEWLKEHSQLTGFNRMIASCLPKIWNTLNSENRTYSLSILIPVYDSICFGCVKETSL